MYKPSFSKCLNRRKRKVSERMLHTCNRAVERVPYSAVYYMVLGKKVITLLKLLLMINHSCPELPSGLEKFSRYETFINQ